MPEQHTHTRNMNALTLDRTHAHTHTKEILRQVQSNAFATQRQLLSSCAYYDYEERRFEQEKDCQRLRAHLKQGTKKQILIT